MKEIVKNTMSAIILTESGRVISKLYGRRNYIIRMEINDKKALIGSFGVMQRCGLMSEYLVYMAQHGTTWAEFTYKRDFVTAINTLEKNGFKIIWID